MEIYIFLIMCIVLLYPLLVRKNNGRNSNLYFSIISLFMIMIVGLRHHSLGIFDTENIYVPNIEKYVNTSFLYIMQNQRKDPIFYLTIKAISMINKNTQFILFVIGIPYLLATTHLIKKYSNIPWLSYILFLGLQFFLFSFYLLRQVAAMAFVILSYDFLKERKVVKFCLCIIVASFFHQTSAIFIIAYPLSKMKIGVRQIGVVGVTFLISLTMRTSLLSKVIGVLNSLLSDATRYDSYIEKGIGLNYTGFFIQLCLLICIFFIGLIKYGTNIFLLNKINNQNQMNILNSDNSELINLAVVSVSMMSLSSVLGEFYRIAAYFGIFLIILLPNVVNTLKNKLNKIFVTSAVTLFFCFYFFMYSLENSNAIPYMFFWQ